MNKNSFEDLYSLDLSAVLDKKIGKFTYLSWPWAMAELSKRDENFDYKIIRYENNPYLKTDCGTFVEVEVTFTGKTKNQIHPVLDNSNKPVESPNAFQINTSIQRAFVKCCGQFGLGLYVYAGEDLPIESDTVKHDKQEAAIKAFTDNYEPILVGAAKEGSKELSTAFKMIHNTPEKAAYWKINGEAIKAIAEQADKGESNATTNA